MLYCVYGCGERVSASFERRPAGDAYLKDGLVVGRLITGDCGAADGSDSRESESGEGDELEHGGEVRCEDALTQRVTGCSKELRKGRGI